MKHFLDVQRDSVIINASPGINLDNPIIIIFIVPVRKVKNKDLTFAMGSVKIKKLTIRRIYGTQPGL